MDLAVRLDQRHTAELGPAERATARAFLAGVFGADFAPEDWEHTLGGIHVMAWDGARLVGHVAVVQRTLLHGGRPLRTGYVEGVAVHPDWRRRGIGGRLMAAAEAIIRAAYDLGALAAMEEARPLYEKRGWQKLLGRSSVCTPEGVKATPEEDGGLYVLVVERAIDLHGELTCDFRAGDVW
jgi:aminoglycoside 2'-N-acetyltransferase I